MEEYLVYIVPKLDAPIKITWESLPCPVLLKLNKSFKCKYAKTKKEGTNYTFYCSAEKCFYKLAYSNT